MDELIKKIAYLKGLADGVNIESEGKCGKVVAAIIDALDELAESVADISVQMDEMDCRLEDTEDIVDILSDELQDDELDEEASEPDDDEDFDDEFDDDDSDFFEIECPNCHEDVMVDFDTIDEQDRIVCPNCHKTIELEFDCDCDCDDCSDDEKEE